MNPFHLNTNSSMAPFGSFWDNCSRSCLVETFLTAWPRVAVSPYLNMIFLSSVMIDFIQIFFHLWPWLTHNHLKKFFSHFWQLLRADWTTAECLLIYLAVVECGAAAADSRELGVLRWRQLGRWPPFPTRLHGCSFERWSPSELAKQR